jgi:succinoglycan biosynthesis protein ExoM
VVVCVVTFRRPAMLTALIGSLCAQRFGGEAPAVEVVVVDNDREASARPVVAAAGRRLPWPLHYRIEPERNIARARNLAIRTARALSPDFLAFVDDDDVVSEQWLEQMLLGLQALGADAVCGPVLPRFDPASPGWIAAGGFFRLKPAARGQLLPYPSMANLLARAALFGGGDEPFDAGFGLLGGSDALLFARWRLAGVRTLAVPEGWVEETIPASRARAGWILRRAFRVGNTAVLVEKKLPAGQRRVLVLGAAALLPALPRGRAATLRALWDLCFGVGSWAAALGYRYEEYRRVHGD